MTQSFPLHRDPFFWLSTLLSFFLLNAGAPANGGTSHLSGTLRINDTPVPNAVVYLLPEKEGNIPSKPVQLTLVQKELAFSPAFSVVTVGSSVFFENHDDKIHNARSNGPSNPFDIGSHLPQTVKQVTLKNPGVVSIQCNVHPEMSALIYVSPSPYADRTDAEGRFKINKVPPGNYILVPWHNSLARKEIAAGRQNVILEKPLTNITLALTAKGGLHTDMSSITKSDWSLEIKKIEAALDAAFSKWQKKRHTSAATKVMQTQSLLYKESGLRNAIAKSLGEPRALALEEHFDQIRKSVHGFKKGVDAAGLKQDIRALVADLEKDAETLKGH
ncbi:MAG: hypothetical protein ACE5F7_00725 [Nitrospiria bacterium]